MNIKYFIDTFTAAFGALIGWFFGDFDGFIFALVAFCSMNYITGVLAAGVKHELSSAVGFKGIARKITIFVLVGIAHVIDKELLGHTALLRDSVIFFYLANEGLSILKNAVIIGIPVPKILKDKLLQIKDNSKQKKS